MIDLNKFYIAKKYTGPSGMYPAAGGFVPPAASGDAGKFLRGDGVWAEVNTDAVSGMVGATSGTDGSAGLVPKPVAGDNRYFLRGDGAWADPNITTIQFINGNGNVILDVENYSTFVINTQVSNQFTYSGFTAGKSINVYITGLTSSTHIHHVFPQNTIFSELGDDNIIYSFNGYATRILLQNIGDYVINFSSIVPVTSSLPYYHDEELNLTVGIGTIILDDYLNNLI